MQRSKKVRQMWHQVDALKMGMNWDIDDLEKPHILVEDTFGESHPGSFHLDKLSEEISVGIYEKGGRPVKFHTTDLCDGWAEGHDGMNYILASKEIIADMVELHGSVIPWDGIVLVSSCDKSIPAHLMAAARIGLPAIHVPGGSMQTAPNLTTSALSGVTSARAKKGNISDKEIMGYKLTGCPGCGACQFMGTASTMQCMSEALGIALPGTALTPASYQHIRRNARIAGKKIMELIRENINVSDILTYDAFINAISVHAAIGGSTNGLLHLPAIAHELGIELKPEVFDEINTRVPYLANVQPSGIYTTELMWFAGGIPMVQSQIKDFLNLDVLTVTGKTLGENLKELEKAGFFEQVHGFLNNYNLNWENIIKPVSKAITKGSIAIMKGNIAPEGAVVKYSAVPQKMHKHTGPAMIFDSEENCHDAIIEGKVEPGSVLVIRYEGPKGSGMPEMHMTTEALCENTALSDTTAIITDGRFSGATKGPCIGHISPEAADGGPIAFIENGDLIEIDIPNRKLDIVGLNGEYENSDNINAILKERASKWVYNAPHRRGVLGKYVSCAVSAIKGGYMENKNL